MIHVIVVLCKFICISEAHNGTNYFKTVINNSEHIFLHKHKNITNVPNQCMIKDILSYVYVSFDTFITKVIYSLNIM